MMRDKQGDGEMVMAAMAAMTLCPSFRSIVADREDPQGPSAPASAEDEFGFEFEFVVAGHEPDAAAEDEEEVGPSDGAAYPVFGREFSVRGGGEGTADRAPSGSSSDLEDLERTPPENYCFWAPRASVPPSPEKMSKSSSTGSASCCRRRLRDLVMGRSHSDGKERFVFLDAAAAKAIAGGSGKRGAGAAEGKKATKKKGLAEKGTVAAAHQAYYGKGRGAATEGWRRTFLPYRSSVIGFLPGLGYKGKSRGSLSF